LSPAIFSSTPLPYYTSPLEENRALNSRAIDLGVDAMF
jgi:hypothetical protein